MNSNNNHYLNSTNKNNKNNINKNNSIINQIKLNRREKNEKSISGPIPLHGGNSEGLTKSRKT